MVEIPGNREGTSPLDSGSSKNASGVSAWFVREVLPLEAALIQFLHHNWRNASEVPDLLHDVYVRTYEAAGKEIRVPGREALITKFGQGTIAANAAVQEAVETSHPADPY